jgi:dual oxidase
VTSDTSDAFDSSSSFLLSYLETYRQHIVILFLFFAFNALAFIERFWRIFCNLISIVNENVISDYRYENEHRDLRRVMGVGIAITRGAAAAMTYGA